MEDITQDLLKHLTLERLEENLFRGESWDIGSPNVYVSLIACKKKSFAEISSKASSGMLLTITGLLI